MSVRIGLFGGRFDPIHNGHLIIAEFIREELHLDKVIFIPAAMPPHKETRTDAGLRLHMVSACTADNPFFEPSDIEIRRQGVTYSVDTIQEIKDSYQTFVPELFWVMGEDNFVEFHKWKDPERIRQLCRIVVFPRTAEQTAGRVDLPPDDVCFLKHAPFLEISSTFVRNLIREGRSVKYLVPPQVQQIISKFGLYEDK